MALNFDSELIIESLQYFLSLFLFFEGAKAMCSFIGTYDMVEHKNRGLQFGKGTGNTVSQMKTWSDITPHKNTVAALVFRTL